MIAVSGSLRGRLLLGGLAVGITFAIVFGVGATWRISQLEDRAVHSALSSRLDLARDEVGPAGQLTSDRSSPKTDLVQVLGPDGQVRSSTTSLTGLGPLVDIKSVARRPEGVEARVTLAQPDVDLAILGVPVDLQSSGSSPAGTGALVVAVDAEGFTTATSRLLGLLVIGLLAVVVAMALLSWFLTGRALRSVALLTERAEAAGPGDLTDGLPVPRNDAELARLVSALNRMLQRLETGHRKELQFAADAGHRLRTPVSTLRAEAELALRSDDPGAHEAALSRIVQDADQLALVVDRMLKRTRSSGESWVPAVGAVTEAAARWERQAELVDVTLRLRVDPKLSDTATCPEIVDVIEPLVDNAIRHTPRHGEVSIALGPMARSGEPLVVVDVSDSGPGVAPELARTIFDAWVSTRDASLAGGLGLWLARETARDLGGDVELTRSQPNGSTFRVTLPLAP